MKEKTFRIYKYIIYALLGLSSILMIGFRRDLIDVGIGQGAFFRYFIPFIIVIGLRRILMIVDRRMSKVNYSLLQTKNEEDLIDKWTKISIADLENPDNRNLYDGCLSESSYKEKLIDSQALMIKNLIIILGTLFILFAYNNLFAILLLAFVGLLISIEAFSLRKAGDIWASYRSNMRRANYFSNVLINSKYLSERKVFATSEFFNQKFSDEFSSASQTNKALGRGRFIRDMAYDLGFIGLIIFYVLTFARPNAPGFSLGLFTSLFYQLIEVKLTVSDLILNFFSYKSAKVVENNYMKFFDLSEEKTGDKPLDTIKSIEFKDVHFTYPHSDKEVLSGLSFKLDQGSYGLVGENGSGKSTITKLMMGLYEVTSGQILINGLDISSYKKSDLKDAMALVFQSSHHYPASLKENLDFKG
ncbi:MAG: ATP-binding cassette domain-containing protein, partial [Ezakiella massiliensis]